MEVQAIIPEAMPILGDGETRASTQAAERVAPEDIHSTFQLRYTDVISASIGSRILSKSDDWFAAASNLNQPTAPIHRPNTFTTAGAWYDGWETRRHNPRLFDWVVFRLGLPSAQLAGVEIDTAFFDGNQAPEIAIQAANCANDEDPKKWGKGDREDEGEWETVLSRQECGPSRRQAWKIPGGLTKKAYTHIRLCMFPDGGIARFRLYGRAVPVFPASTDAVIDLAAVENGGVAVACSDQHFGVISNLLLPGRGKDMGDGWETKRSRGGDHVDWAMIRLGAEAELEKIVVDTAFFRGNYPQGVRVEGIRWTGDSEPTGSKSEDGWIQVLDNSRCGPDKEHAFSTGDLDPASAGRTFTHLKLIMIPDGGIKRFRVFGWRKSGV